MKVNPDTIILARERKGWRQKDLEEKSGISQSLISKFEIGARTPTDLQLEKLAEVLSVPSDFFYQPWRRYSFGSSCTYHRKQSSLSAVDLSKLLAEINVLRNHVDVLSGALEIEPQFQIPRLDADDFGGDVKQLAQLARQSLAVPPGPIRSLTSVLESAGCVIQFTAFGTRKLDAISQWFPPSLPVFLVNSEAPVDRQRFTMAHELGHLVAHESPNPEMEPQADAFASEFLMPSEEIKPMLYDLKLDDLHTLKLYWRVSMSAIVRKARDLSTIDEKRYRSLMVELSRRGYRKREPDVLYPEEPNLLNTMLKIYEGELEYSPDDFSRLLRENKETVYRLYNIGSPELTLFTP